MDSSQSKNRKAIQIKYSKVALLLTCENNMKKKQTKKSFFERVGRSILGFLISRCLYPVLWIVALF